ncbi:hypothetical protein [Carboxylicivirga linearis]|uniref:Uncharacterized protein n=1 Tax=Carboxylicivirga linearis TaxID=1628157 RepID=A0ABS5JW93_9BACT|nr:hypothetical protein [Carboxylicivirga linearis]MBS2099177.1 hypothetical protein [Carboxylicivirga linearis]
MEAWTDLYNEIAQRINDKLPEVSWVDLWHEQVSYLTEEIPFPTPAVFIGFNTNGCNDLSQLIQECDLQVDMYLFFESFGDTYHGAYNQGNAIDYLRLLSKLHAAFHGVSGEHFQTMRRVDMHREESGGSGNLYRISFNCNVEDASAQAEFNQNEVNDITISDEPIERPSTTDDEPIFILHV